MPPCTESTGKASLGREHSNRRHPALGPAREERSGQQDHVGKWLKPREGKGGHEVGRQPEPRCRTVLLRGGKWQGSCTPGNLERDGSGWTPKQLSRPAAPDFHQSPRNRPGCPGLRLPSFLPFATCTTCTLAAEHRDRGTGKWAGGASHHLSSHLPLLICMR